ncbi:cytochrome C assembly family protein [Paucisalibacillus globulus]|uniref:cytochrome C assembly family protein n=1 Tax=Paucisalibacillus globulus TaxID=351095 RepID=UPI0004178964|nr:cytochrome c biogenesis protein CcsA [Paucisalibacillus globulus]
MVDVRFIYEGILFIYILSLIGFFIDFLQQNRKAKKFAFWLLCMVWLSQTFFLFQHVLIEKSFPIATIADSLYFYAWVLATFSIWMNRLFKMNFIVFFINLFGFFIFLMHVSLVAQAEIDKSGIQLVDEILIAHISFAIISYGFFTISFLTSLMYMVQYHFLKEKKALKWMWRLGDLNRLDHFTYRTISIGVPLLFIGILLGFVWAYTEQVEFYWFDVKTLGSILVLIVYIIYLLLRIVRRFSGKTLAKYNTYAFLILIINFFLFTSLSNFHI